MCHNANAANLHVKAPFQAVHLKRIYIKLFIRLHEQVHIMLKGIHKSIITMTFREIVPIIV